MRNMQLKDKNSIWIRWFTLVSPLLLTEKRWTRMKNNADMLKNDLTVRADTNFSTRRSGVKSFTIYKSFNTSDFFSNLVSMRLIAIFYIISTNHVLVSPIFMLWFAPTQVECEFPKRKNLNIILSERLIVLTTSAAKEADDTGCRSVKRFVPAITHAPAASPLKVEALFLFCYLLQT